MEARRATREGTIHDSAMRFFTEDEANDALAAVRSTVERLVAGRRRFVHLARRLEEVQAHVGGNGGGLDPERVRELQTALAEAATAVDAVVAELERLGVQVKDLDEGLVDFPARHPDREETVLLCWRLGEEKVAFWHGLEEGFAGRKPLPF
jgi:hypothetical protein